MCDQSTKSKLFGKSTTVWGLVKKIHKIHKIRNGYYKLNEHIKFWTMLQFGIFIIILLKAKKTPTVLEPFRDKEFRNRNLTSCPQSCDSLTKASIFSDIKNATLMGQGLLSTDAKFPRSVFFEH